MDKAKLTAIHEALVAFVNHGPTLTAAEFTLYRTLNVILQELTGSTPVLEDMSRTLAMVYESIPSFPPSDPDLE